MKFWELTAVFGDWPEMLREVLASDRWRDPYLAQYEQNDRLVGEQDRAVLDAIVPLELSRELAVKCPTRFIFDPAFGCVRQPWTDGPLPAGSVGLSAVEVHDRFGGSTLEEVREKGVARVTGAS